MLNNGRFYIGDRDGKQITISLLDAYNIMIGGRVGSGKSNLLKWIIATLPTPIIIIDPKQGAEFKEFKNLKKLATPDIVKTPEHTKNTLDHIVKELDTRFAKFEALKEKCVKLEEYNSITGEELPHIVIVIDEFQEVIKGNSEALFKIAKLGRAAGIHLILATQKPESRIQGASTLNSQCNCRIALQVNSHSDSTVILGDSKLSAEKLKNKGDFIVKLDGQSTTGHTPYYNF